MMSPQSSGLVPSYVTKIELGQIGATLVLPVSLHSDKFVAAGGEISCESPGTGRQSHLCSQSELRPAPVLPSKLILAEGGAQTFSES